MGMHHSPRIVRDGLGLLLDPADINCYPGSGTAITDLSGNNKNGTLDATLTYSTNNQGIFEFDGTDDDILIPNVGPSNWTSPFTMAIWVNIPSVATWSNGLNGTIFANTGGYSGTFGLIKRTTNNEVGMWVRGDNGAIASNYSNFPRDTWKYLTGIWTGVNTYLYVDGVLASGPDGSARTGVPDTAQLTVGRARAFSGNVGNWLEGSVGGAKFYNKVLTPDEILQNYEAQKTRFGL